MHLLPECSLQCPEESHCPSVKRPVLRMSLHVTKPLTRVSSMNNMFLTRLFALLSCMRQNYRTLALTWQARQSHISCTCLRARKSLTNVRSFEVSSSLHLPFCLEAPSFSSRHRSLHPSGKRPRDVLISFHLDPFSPTSCLSWSSSSLLHLPYVQQAM